MQKKKDKVEDETAKKAKDNVTSAEVLIGDCELYEETLNPNFSEKQNAIQEILDKHGENFG